MSFNDELCVTNQIRITSQILHFVYNFQVQLNPSDSLVSAEKDQSFCQNNVLLLLQKHDLVNQRLSHKDEEGARPEPIFIIIKKSAFAATCWLTDALTLVT